MHYLHEYSKLAIAVAILVAAIAVAYGLHELFTDKGQHAKPRRDQRAEKAELEQMMDRSLPDYDGRTYSATRGHYDPNDYREIPEDL